MKVNEVFCLTQSLGSDVGAVRPTQSSTRNKKLLKDSDVTKRSEDFASQPGREIDRFLRAIVETETKAMARHIMSLDDGDEFLHTQELF